MKEKDFQSIFNALKNIAEFETLEQKEAYLKQIKRTVLKLEIAVIVSGLISLSLIILPFFGILSFSTPIVLAIICGVLFIIRAFQMGWNLETEEFFLKASIANEKNQEKEK